VEDWQTDSNKTREPQKILQGQALKTANAAKAIALALQGYISRAVRLIESDQDKADMLAPEVQAQAKENTWCAAKKTIGTRKILAHAPDSNWTALILSRN
jgi:hypothetical protein